VSKLNPLSANGEKCNSLGQRPRVSVKQDLESEGAK